MASIFDRKDHGLGAMADEWVPKHTKDGDDLATLASKYGVKSSDILSRNGVQATSAAIQNWVKSTGGKVLPYSVASHPFTDSKEGWAVFTANSVIMLPSNSRTDGEPAINSGTPSIAPASSKPLTKAEARAKAVEEAKAIARAAAEARLAAGQKSPDMGSPVDLKMLALVGVALVGGFVVLKKMGKI